ncbi:hypothetical protein HYH02_003432 [Chlamydomonas schloesseri]|uniref:Phosphodiesterase n=1 Tax=Chlamydomonas schloesseri TaxID=2026947 RepID=A0A835WQJ8_9CHLO|nr:hypothetical protein HYH02_003432 [Chlamydomonas schloesseri]|eukprot:KAG2451652.1 hypothetical protein HYH02_003432 [Chlamydomonas schloesseri]
MAAADAAVWIERQLSAAIAPALVAAALVQYGPQWGSAEHLFLGLAPSLLAQAPNNSIRALQLQPSGVIRSVHPFKGNENAVGLDLFATGPNRESALKAVRDRTMTLSGPMDLIQGFYGVIIRQPVFVRGTAPNATFGVPDPLPNPACGEPCAYSAQAGIFWGFATVAMDWDAVLSDPTSKLASLRRLGFRYTVAVVGAPPGSRAVAASRAPPEHPVRATINLPNAQWEVLVSPDSGWNADWYAGLLAGVVVLSVAVAVAMFVALLSRRQHQMLLEALLPKELIHDLREENTASLTACPRMNMGETPADLLLDMMCSLLEGYAPDLRDVVFIRTALLRNMDLYTPLNVKKQIKGANLDAEVAQALMQQLVGGTGHQLSTLAPYRSGVTYTHDGSPMPGCASPDGHSSGQHGPGGGATAGVGGVLPAPPHLMALRRSGGSAYNLETVSGALAFVLSPDADMTPPAPPPSALPHGGPHGPAALQLHAVAGGGGGGRLGLGSLAGIAGQNGAELHARSSMPLLPQQQHLPHAAQPLPSQLQRQQQLGAPRQEVSLDGALLPPSLSHGGHHAHTHSTSGGVAGSGAGTGLPIVAVRLHAEQHGPGSAVASGGHGGALSAGSLHEFALHSGGDNALPLAREDGVLSLGTSPVLTGRGVGLAAIGGGAPTGACTISFGGLRRGGADPEAPAGSSSLGAVGGGGAGGWGSLWRSPARASSGLTREPSASGVSVSRLAGNSLRGMVLSGGGNSPVPAAGAGGGGVEASGPSDSAWSGGGMGVGAAKRISTPSRMALFNIATASGNGSSHLGTAGSGPASAGGGCGTGGGGGSVTPSPRMRERESGRGRSDSSPQPFAISAQGVQPSAPPGAMSPLFGSGVRRGTGPGSVLGLAAGAAAAAASAEDVVLRVAAPPVGISAALPSPMPAYLPVLPSPIPVVNIVEQAEKLLARVDEWQFDMLEVAKATNGHALSVVGFFILQKSGLISRFKLNPVVLARFLRCVESGYVNTPYHNSTHAADVLQMLHVIIHNAQLHVHYLDELGLLAMYFAAVIHDFGHPGLTGDFLINTSDQLALRYNDRSPLENHHCAAAFTLMRRPEFDLLAPLSAAERSSFRKQVIELVLATDMKQHFSILSHFNTVHRLAAYSQQQQQAQPATSGGPPAAVCADGHSKPFSIVKNPSEVREVAAAVGELTAPKPLDDTERSLSLQVALKCADISNLGRELECYKRWVALLEEEMFLQGDKERELGITISPLCDRTKLGVSKSQTGFFDFVALPLVHAMTSAFPGAARMMHHFLTNYNHWKAVAPATSPQPPAAAHKADSETKSAVCAVELAPSSSGRPTSGGAAPEALSPLASAPAALAPVTKAMAKLRSMGSRRLVATETQQQAAAAAPAPVAEGTAVNGRTASKAHAEDRDSREKEWEKDKHGETLAAEAPQLQSQHDQGGGI